MCRKNLSLIVLIGFFLVGCIAGCASDGTAPSRKTADNQASAETQTVEEKKTKRKKLTLDGGRKRKQSPALKNAGLPSPPSSSPDDTP